MELVSTLAKRFNEALKIKNMKQADIVRITNIGKSSISTYLNGEYEPKQKNTYKIAKALNVSETWLMGYDVPMERTKLYEDELGGLNRNNSIKDYHFEEPNKYVLDLYNSLSSQNQLEAVRYMRFLKTSNNSIEPKIQILGQTAAGNPIEYGDSYAQGIDDVSNIPDNADYALIVNGDSMEPTIKNGQLVYVKKTPEVENGEIAVIEIDGAVTCKKVYKWADHIELQSINKAYESIIITAGNFKILGKVIL